MQMYNNCGGVMEESVDWKTRVGSPKTRMRRGVGCSLCSKASLVVSYCQGGQPVLSLSPIPSSFPWVGSGNHMATRWVFYHISLQTILGGGGKEEERFVPRQPAESACPVAVWLGTGGGGVRAWWQTEGVATGAIARSAQATREPQLEAVFSWSLS